PRRLGSLRVGTLLFWLCGSGVPAGDWDWLLWLPLNALLEEGLFPIVGFWLVYVLKASSTQALRSSPLLFVLAGASCPSCRRYHGRA
ncbi:hypothetical protein B0A49_13958, partial [Cryomyces minteri]